MPEKKFALCLSGHMRAWQECLPFWQPLVEKCDVYISTWDEDVDAYRSAYNPVELVVESFDDKQRIFRDATTEYREWGKELPYRDKMTDYYSLYYKIWHCYSLLKRNYDVVIRSRPDLTMERIPEEIWNPNPESIYTIITPTGWDGGAGERFVNDTFFSGNHNTMTKACSLHENFSNLYSQLKEQNDLSGFFNAHVLLHEHLKSQNINQIQLSVPFELHHK